MLLLIAVLPVAAWVLWQSQRVFRADMASRTERHQLVLWASGVEVPASPAEWAAAVAAVQRSISLTPEDPALHEALGDLYFVEARRLWPEQAARSQALDLAAKHYREAIALRPSEPQTWAMLATVLQGMGAESRLVNEAWARSVALGPYEGHVRPLLLRVVLSDWDHATPGMQQWVKTLFDGGNSNLRQSIEAMAKDYGLSIKPDGATAP